MKTEIPTINDELNYISQIVGNEIPYEDTGKLLRSKIGILLLKACGIEPDEKYLSVLVSGELIHAASLMHDDVIDNAEIRRGEDALRSKEGDKISVIIGDKLLTKALGVMVDLGNLEVIENFNRAISDMCEGEILQNQNLGEIQNLDDYIEKTKLKTASLFTAIIKNLCVVSGYFIPMSVCEFGENFGTAFQILNDLDDALGKQSDVTKGIYTAPYIFSGCPKLSGEAIEKTACLIDNYSRRAVESLVGLEDTPYKAELIRMSECLKK